MNIGAIIREKRRSKDMTQENLSEVLGVSVSAVSLWESGKTMPDIGLLPALCSVLAVSADELLGIDIDRKEEQINAIVEQSHKASDRGYTKEGIEILEAGLKKYPDSYFIMSQLMDLNHSLAINEDDTQARSRAIELGETILEKCTDSGLRSSAVQILCFQYRENNPERAEKLLYSMDTMSTCQEVLATTTLTGEKKQEAQHHLIQQTLDLMTVSMGLYGYTDDRYTYNEWASVLEKIIAIYNIVYENGDFGFYHDRLMDAEKPLAIYYASKGDTGKKHWNICGKRQIMPLPSCSLRKWKR
ncbi:MAG: helix-turn-helix domain-containing protein [Clostridia bacterium]|nr:helix-turn-helix domain-containing protein [Clostridia bacterium]